MTRNVTPAELSREQKLLLSQDLLRQASLSYDNKAPLCHECTFYVWEGQPLCEQPLVSNVHYDDTKRAIVRGDVRCSAARLDTGVCGPRADLFSPATRAQLSRRKLRSAGDKWRKVFHLERVAALCFVSWLLGTLAVIGYSFTRPQPDVFLIGLVASGLLWWAGHYLFSRLRRNQGGYRSRY